MDFARLLGALASAKRPIRCSTTSAGGKHWIEELGKERATREAFLAAERRFPGIVGP